MNFPQVSFIRNCVLVWVIELIFFCISLFGQMDRFPSADRLTRGRSAAASAAAAIAQLEESLAERFGRVTEEQEATKMRLDQLEVCHTNCSYFIKFPIVLTKSVTPQPSLTESATSASLKGPERGCEERSSRASVACLGFKSCPSVSVPVVQKPGSVVS